VGDKDELIFSSLFAFIAGNLGVYANRPIALQLESASRQYLERSFNMLKTYMDQAAQSPNGTPRPGTILPMQYACFLLACYGVCAAVYIRDNLIPEFEIACASPHVQ
jgi:hypothetical protein